MAGRSRLDINVLLVEGMIAIRILLDGQNGEPNAEAALEIADAMHNLQPNPIMLGNAVAGFEKFRANHPDIAEKSLPKTFAWIDSNKDG